MLQLTFPFDYITDLRDLNEAASIQEVKHVTSLS